MDEHHKVRKHIRHILFDYAKTHLTTDHVAYTFNVVNELAPSFLKQVPFVNALSLTLPSDPFDVLARLYNFEDDFCYEEKFRPVPEATQLVKDCLRTRTDALKTKRVIGHDDPVRLVSEPLSPVLSRRSIKISRSSREASFPSSLPKALPGLLQDYGLRGLEVEAVPEPDVPFERTLKITWSMNAEERDEVRNLLKIVADMRRPQTNYENSVLHAPLHDNLKHQVCPVPCEQQFIPIFPRNRRMAAGNSNFNQKLSCGSQSTHFLRSILPVTQITPDDSEDAPLLANLEVINGWETFKISSPSSASTPTSSQEEERIDQLFMENTPPTDPLTELANEKMEEYYIPRSRRIGGSFGRNPHILHGKGIGDLLPILGNAETRVAVEPSSSSPIPESLIGQPSLADDYEKLKNTGLDPSDDDIRSLCRNENPTDIIMKARIEGDSTFPVPELPPPNVHNAPKPTSLPTNIMDLVAYQEQNGMPLIRKAKGLAALRLALSWVTFTIDSPLPTHDEIITMDSVLSEEIEHLYNRSFIIDGVEFRERDISMPTGDEPSITVGEDFDAFIIARPRRDRVGITRSIEDDHFSDGVSSRLVKRPRLDGPSKQDVRYPSSTPQSENMSNSRICSRPALDPGNMNLDTPVAAVTNDSNNLVDQLIKNVVASAETLQVPPSVYLSSQAHQLNAFAHLRGKMIINTAQATEPSVDTVHTSRGELPEPCEGIVTEILNQSTLQLPAFIDESKITHKYMASMEFVQRQAIVRALRTGCNAELAERMSLGPVDIIIDPHTCVVVVSLFTLPAHSEAVVNQVSEQSWRFRLILVLLEAYPESMSLKPVRALSDAVKISAFTPPILKALKKMRRDVIIREARQEKRPECRIEYAIATEPSEAARFIRYLGDLAEEADESGGRLWGEREWLEWEVSADEEALAQMRGMNRMSALIMLCQATAEEIVTMSPEERIAAFQPLIGFEVVNAVNDEIEKRLQVIEDSERDYSPSSELNHFDVS